jgi:hypothetical protein
LLRLLDTAERRHGSGDVGIGNRIADYVESLERPLVTMGELLQVEGMTEELLFGENGEGGLTAFLTVFSDGKINIDSAPDDVLVCLGGGGMRNKATADAVRDKIANPGKRVPKHIKNIVKRIKPFVTTEGGAWHARITLSGEYSSKEAEVALRREGSALVTVLFNELGGKDAHFSR